LEEEKIGILSRELLPWVRQKEKQPYVVPSAFIEGIAKLDQEKIHIFCTYLATYLAQRAFLGAEEIQLIDELKSLDNRKFTALCSASEKFFRTSKPKDSIGFVRSLKMLDPVQIEGINRLLPDPVSEKTLSVLVQDVPKSDVIEEVVAEAMGWFIEGKRTQDYRLFHDDFKKGNFLSNVFLKMALADYLYAKRLEARSVIRIEERDGKVFVLNKLSQQFKELTPVVQIDGEEDDTSLIQSGISTLPRDLDSHFLSFLDCAFAINGNAKNRVHTNFLKVFIYYFLIYQVQNYITLIKYWT
jgi:hypothetical protein